jgi:hypothetical protein
MYAGYRLPAERSMSFAAVRPSQLPQLVELVPEDMEGVSEEENVIGLKEKKSKKSKKSKKEKKTKEPAAAPPPPPAAAPPPPPPAAGAKHVDHNVTCICTQCDMYTYIYIYVYIYI